MQREGRLLDLAGALYAAAQDDSAWTGLAERLAGVLGAPSAAFHLRNPDEVRLLDFTENLRLRDEKERKEAAYWRARDVWALRATAAGLGRVFLGPELIGSSELERTDFYNEWCRPREEFHLVGAAFALEDGRIATFGVHRPKEARPFGEDERRLGMLLLEHYKRALQLRCRLQRLALERQATLDALARTPLAVLLLGPDLTLIHSCPEGERLLREADGLRVTLGRVAARRRSTGEGLAAAVRAAVDLARGNLGSSAGRGARDSLAVERPGRLPLTLQVSPFHPPGGPPAALVFLRDPESMQPDAGTLRQLFDLTGAEAGVCVLLAQGCTVQEAAARLGIGLNTIRTHIRRALSKTGTTRQAELVGLVHRSVAMLRSAAPPRGDAIVAPWLLQPGPGSAP